MYTKNVQNTSTSVGFIFQIPSDFRQLPQLLVILKKLFITSHSYAYCRLFEKQ